MPVEEEGERPFPRRRSGIEVGEGSPDEGKKFAQIGAVGLVRREIRCPVGKFFLGAVQAVGARPDRWRAIVAWSSANAPLAVAKKKKRVLPMFFFRRMSFVRAGRFGSRHRAAVAIAVRRRPAAPASKKKLRAGVDT